METNLNDNLKNTSVSVLMINSQGMMLSVLGNDYFVSYNRVPWLRNARISSALNVRMAGKNAIMEQDANFSREYCTKLCTDIWGDLWE